MIKNEVEQFDGIKCDLFRKNYFQVFIGLKLDENVWIYYNIAKAQ